MYSIVIKIIDFNYFVYFIRKVFWEFCIIILSIYVFMKIELIKCNVIGFYNKGIVLFFLK